MTQENPKRMVLRLLGALAAVLLAAGCATTPDVDTGAGEAPAAAPSAGAAWGLEVVALRLAGAGHLVDLRYRIDDAEKAASLFNSQTKPYLIHEASGKVLSVPVTAKLGPLRSKYKPQQGRTYSMLFGTPSGLVRSGDRATLVLGELRVEELTVE